jgi:SAM-dependent methyltransferase
MHVQPYTEPYYRKLREGARRSAREIVPLVLELIQPESIIDVGCGLGTWLRVFKEFGVEDVLGIDGDHVDPNMLEIPKEQFLTFDLKRPFQMERQFDLVVSLEVAEHLPTDCAKMFVDSLTRLGPAILFSAAQPSQGGENHVNEQWPDYWANHFQKKGYMVTDCVRKRIWENPSVEWWYAQNTLIFVSSDYLEGRPSLKRQFANTAVAQLPLVHPRSWRHRVQLAKEEVTGLVPPGESLILVDQQQFGSEFIDKCYAIPFLERDGLYWGPPSDDETAIRELERLRRSGAGFIVFGWPAFWWLDYYAELNRYLRSRFRCVLENERLVVFDLRQ